MSIHDHKEVMEESMQAVNSLTAAMRLVARLRGALQRECAAHDTTRASRNRATELVSRLQEEAITRQSTLKAEKEEAWQKGVRYGRESGYVDGQLAGIDGMKKQVLAALGLSDKPKCNVCTREVETADVVCDMCK